MKKLFGFALILISSFVLSACASEPSLTVLTSSGYEPYEMVDESGELIGFDIDLMEAIAEELGVKLVWQDVNFDGILASLQSKTADLAIAGISPSEERALNVDFSNVYYSSAEGLENYIVFESSSNITSLSDLEGKKVGTQLGTIQEELMNTLSETYDYEVETRTTNAQIIEEIKNGLMDALVVEKLVAERLIEANPGFEKVLVDSDLDQMYGNAIAFPKDSEWVDDVNKALETLIENGTLEALIDKWFNQ